MWHYIESGSGRPLVLLHGIGMSHAAWKPVLPLLSADRRVIAFDIAGFGKTPPLPAGTVPTVPRLAEELGRCLREMGVTRPVDIAGSSLGGYIALEVAKLGLARSVVAVSPAGLWKVEGSPHVKYLFAGMRRGTRSFPGMTRAMLKVGVVRGMLLSVPISTGSRKMPAEDAIQAAEDLANAEAFEETFSNIGAFTNGQSIDCPVTVAFGKRDCLLPRSSQRRDELPAHTELVRPAKWGHVPMWSDPEGVSRLILEGTQ